MTIPLLFLLCPSEQRMTTRVARSQSGPNRVPQTACPFPFEQIYLYVYRDCGFSSNDRLYDQWTSSCCWYGHEDRKSCVHWGGLWLVACQSTSGSTQRGTTTTLCERTQHCDRVKCVFMLQAMTTEKNVVSWTTTISTTTTTMMMIVLIRTDSFCARNKHKTTHEETHQWIQNHRSINEVACVDLVTQRVYKWKTVRSNGYLGECVCLCR